MTSLPRYETSLTRRLIEATAEQDAARAFVAQVDWPELARVYAALGVNPEGIPALETPDGTAWGYLALRRAVLSIPVSGKRQTLAAGLSAELTGALAACVNVLDLAGGVQ